jgi:hypothetical protein
MRSLLAAAIILLALPAAAPAVVVTGRPHTELALAGSSPIWWEAGGTLYSAVDGRRRVLHRDTTSCIGSYRHIQASGRRVAAVHTMTRLDPSNGGCFGSGSELLVGSARSVRTADLGGCGTGGAIDGKRVLTGACGGGLAVRELGRAAPLRQLPWNEKPFTSIYHGATALGGRYAAYVISGDDVIVMVDWQAGKEVGRWSIAKLRQQTFFGDLAPQVRVTADGLLVASVPPADLSPHWLVWTRPNDKQLHRVPFRKYGAWDLHGRTIAAYRVKPRGTALFTVGGKTVRTLARGFGGGAALSATHVAWISSSGGTIRVLRR